MSLFAEMNNNFNALHKNIEHSVNLFMKANITSSNLEPEEQITVATDVTQQLIQATEPQGKSLLPNDLGASTRILTGVVSVLEKNNVTNEVRIFFLMLQCPYSY